MDGRPDEANTLCLDGSAVANQVSNMSDLCALLTMRGLIAADSVNYEEAEALFLQALAVSRRLRRDVNIVESMFNLAGVLFRRGDHAQAGERLKECMLHIDELEEQSLPAKIVYLQAKVTEELGRAKEASSWYRLSLEKAINAKDSGLVVEVAGSVIELATKRKNYQGITSLLGSVIRYLSAWGDLEAEKEIRNMLRRIPSP